MLEFLWGLSILCGFIFIPLANVQNKTSWFVFYICVGWFLAPLFLIVLLKAHKDRTESRRKGYQSDIAHAMERLDKHRVDKKDKL
jgi:hypothetical protein